MAVEEQAVQQGIAGQLDPPLLHQFAAQRLVKGFADLDAAARQMPAGDIAVLDQKYPVFAVQHHGADPERHAAGEPPVEMENPAQHRLEPLVSRPEGSSRRTLRVILHIAFDPCAAPAGLPILSRFQGYREMIEQRLRPQAPKRTMALHAGTSVGSASAAVADGAAARSRGQARARLSELDPQPPQIPPARGARRAGRRYAGAAARPHRGYR